MVSSPVSGTGSKSSAAHVKGFDSLPFPPQESRRLTGKREAWNLRCHWSSLVARGAMVGVEEPVLPGTRGLWEPFPFGGYLMTLTKRI